MSSVRALLAGVVDYAGLFPPARLSMPAAVAEYEAARRGAEAWMLGRFVVPADRLSAFSDARPACGPSADCWPLSAIVRDCADADEAAVAAFNADAARHAARVDTVESRPHTLDGIDWLARKFGADFEVYVEVPAGDDAAPWLERVAARGLKGKVRTGGLTADAFPTPAALLAFIDAAVRLRVPFKATAGLHHPLCGSYRLSYEPGAAHAPMYGYLNVLLATAARAAGLAAHEAEALLCQEDAASLAFGPTAVRWGAVELPLDAVRDLRREQLVSFGSCSFREPVDELRALTSF